MIFVNINKCVMVCAVKQGVRVVQGCAARWQHSPEGQQLGARCAVNYRVF